MLGGELAQAGEEGQPTTVASVVIHEPGEGGAGVAPLYASGTHWWHRGLEPGGCSNSNSSANAPNRVMYATDNCTNLWLAVLEPADNEQYTWTFYRPDGTHYTSVSCIFYYPNNPANPEPGYYTLLVGPCWWYTPLKPSRWDVAQGVYIAAYEPSRTPGRWRADITSGGTTVVSEYFIMRAGLNNDPARTYASEGSCVSADPA